MLIRALPWLLDEAGIEASHVQLAALEDLLWVTEKDEHGTLIYPL